MLEEAEKNAILDKSKKVIVNYTYELDNLLSKTDELSSSGDLYNVFKISTVEYYEETIKQIQECYQKNSFTELASEAVRDLKYIYNVLVYEWVKDQVSNQAPKDRSGVIDVDIVD